MTSVNISELLINLNEIKLGLIGIIILGLVFLLKPVVKDILYIFIDKFRNGKSGKQ
ncbi:holin, BlyA family (plasmid) [Borrelia turcica IST7]|uniref:Holin, BlyA family n=1 Tax=Borrelia turcica IST7 TaxID=1104446 RepID=A0A386PPQ7_9SPIR|nr:BlyA family holin [Borrelia turcica]AYE37088.1 holin, BlyA family [Borrelia turcica IST7]